MQLGISSYTYPWSIGVPGYLPPQRMSALDLLERAQKLGASGVQIADNLPLGSLPESELRQLETRAAELGLWIEVGTRGIQPEHLHAYLALAKRFRSPILRVVIDTSDHHPAPQEAVELLRPLRLEFERAGVTLAIENHDRFPAAALADMVRALGTNWTGICLDIVNSFGAMEGPELVVNMLAPLTVNLHLKDFTIYRPAHNLGFRVEGRPAGQGRMGIPWLLARLREEGRAFNAILELWTPPGATIEQTLAREEQWARESMAYLKQTLK
jgi:sugar phosphate isomerase/epimerase